MQYVYCILSIPIKLLSTDLQQDIVKALEEVCKIFKGDTQSECDALISEYGPMIIKLLVGEVTPQELCKVLTLCSSEEVIYHFLSSLNRGD